MCTCTTDRGGTAGDGIQRDKWSDKVLTLNGGKTGESFTAGTVLTENLVSVLNPVSDDLHRSWF